MKKALIIKTNDDSFDQVVNHQFEKAGCTIVDIRKILSGKNRIQNIIKIYRFVRTIPFNEYERIIVFDIDMLYFLLFMFGDKKKSFLWFWNSLDTYSLKRIKRFIYRMLPHIYSFNRSDVNSCGIKYNTQFFFNTDEYSDGIRGINQNVFFVGVDKNRYSLLKELADTFDEYYITYKFLIFPDKNKTYTDSHIITHDFVPYEKVINYVRHSEIVLDICKDHQDGMTFRAMEALWLDKRIITNNQEYLNYNFYNKNKVFIIGRDSNDDLVKFVKKESREDPYSSNVKEYYSIDNWLERFKYKHKRESAKI